MLDILREHLRTGASPEIAVMIEQAHDLFDEFGLEDYDIGFSEILLTADNEGASEVLMKVTALTEQLQDVILAQLQVDLVDEATVSEANRVLLALKHLDKTEYNAEIVQICEEVTSPEEALAEVLALVSGEEEENLVILLETVGPSLIQKIKEVCAQRAFEERTLQNNIANKVYAENLVLYSQAVDNQWLFIMEQVRNGEPLGKLYSEYHAEIISAMESRRVEQPMLDRDYAIKVAVQLFAGAIISEDGVNNPRAVVMAELTKTYGDLDRITPIYLELDSLSIRFQSYKQGAIALTDPESSKTVLPKQGEEDEAS